MPPCSSPLTEFQPILTGLVNRTKLPLSLHIANVTTFPPGFTEFRRLQTLNNEKERKRKPPAQGALCIIIVKVHYSGNGEKQSVHNLVRGECEHQRQLSQRMEVVSKQHAQLCSGVAWAPVNKPLCRKFIEYCQGRKRVQ